MKEIIKKKYLTGNVYKYILIKLHSGLNKYIIEILLSHSDEDSDVEISDKLTNDKKAVLDFMQTALPSELLLMSYCSKTKADAIIKARPFESWSDLVNKFQNTRYLDTELLNAAQVNL